MKPPAGCEDKHAGKFRDRFLFVSGWSVISFETEDSLQRSVGSQAPWKQRLEEMLQGNMETLGHGKKFSETNNCSFFN